MRRLVEAGVVGLGFGVGVQHAEVPAALVAAAAAAGLPLLQVPEQTAFVAVGRSVWEALAAEQYAEVTRTSSAQQELTRAAVASGAAGLLRRLAERLDGWALLLDAGGAVQQAAPAGAGRRGAWLATELERFRDLSTPVSATLSVEDDQIAVQSLRLGRRTGGFLAVGSPQRLNREQRTVVNTAVSLLTLMLAQTSALRVAESQLRTAVLELLVDGEPARAAKLAGGLWGGLPADPVRLLLAAGPATAATTWPSCWTAASGSAARTRPRRRTGCCTPRSADRLAVVYPAAGRLRGRVLAAAAGTAGVVAGESTEAGSAELARALREAEQALAAGIRAGARLTCVRRHRRVRPAQPAGRAERRRVRRVAAAPADRARPLRPRRPGALAGHLAGAQRRVGRGGRRRGRAPAHPAPPDPPGRRAARPGPGRGRGAGRAVDRAAAAGRDRPRPSRGTGAARRPDRAHRRAGTPPRALTYALGPRSSSIRCTRIRLVEPGVLGGDPATITISAPTG